MRETLQLVLICIGAAQTISAQQLGIEAAQRGGVVIVCRHGITDALNENEMTLRYDDPSTQRRLNAKGERQVELIGKAFRELKISVGETVTSPMDRAKRTGELAFGTVRLDSAWHTRGTVYTGFKHDDRVRLLSSPVERGNRLIVSHLATMTYELPSINGRIEEGDCAVVRPRGENRYEVVDVVPWRAWLQAARLDSSLPQS